MKKYNSLQYNNYVKRCIIICCLFLIVPIVHIISKNPNEQLNLFYFVVPFVIALCFVFISSISRRITLGNLMAFEIDMDLVYKLDKRKDTPKNKIHNLELLLRVKFYAGDFDEVVDCCNEILKLTDDYNKIYVARHYMILSLFLSENFTEIPNLIKIQSEISGFVTKVSVCDSNLYYDFIEHYLANQHNEAVQIILKTLDVKNIEVLNYKKVLIYYLIRKSSVKINDSELLQKCNDEIFKADINKSTFFTKSIMMNK